MNKEITYINRYSDKYTFKLNDDNNIDWKGEFKYCRYGFEVDPNIKTMVDPSGGPFISIGTNMGTFDESFKNMIVTGFNINKEKVEIIIKKDDKS